MSISISEAARRWGVGRETIYRKHRKSEISFIEGDPPTIDAAEMLRVFGEPGQKKAAAKAKAGDLAAQVRAEVQLDAQKAEIERLKSELASAKNELDKERDDAKKEREKVLDLLASQQRLIESQTRKPTLLERIGFRRGVAG